MAGSGRERSAADTGRAAVGVLAALAAVVTAVVVLALAGRRPHRSPVRCSSTVRAPVFSTVPATWVRQELWVETTIDSDFDGQLDRIHIDVTRVQETDTIGLEVPVVMEVGLLRR